MSIADVLTAAQKAVASTQATLANAQAALAAAQAYAPPVVTPPSSDAYWESIKTAQGVLNWRKYDYVDPAKLNDPAAMASIGPQPILGFDARGPRPVGGTKFYPYYWAYGEIPDADPYIDPDVKLSGTGSLRLTTQCWQSVATHRDGDNYPLTDKTNLPALSANPGGSASINFSNDFSVFIGAGQQVCYQWDERCDDTAAKVKHFGATSWVSGGACTVSGAVITGATYQNMNPGHYVRLFDASGNIVGNHSIASVAHPVYGKPPTVITLANNYNPATGDFDAPLSIDPAAVSFAYQAPIGPKLMIATCGDYYAGVTFGQNHLNNQMHWSMYGASGVPIMSQGHTPDPLWQPAGTTPTGSGNWMLQNALSCSFTTMGNCFRPIPGEWGRRRVLIDLTQSPGVQLMGNYYRWPNSAVKVWAAHEGGPMQLLVDWNPSTPGYVPLEAAGGMGSYPKTTEQKYGKLNMMNYLSYLDPTMVFPTYRRWYDRVIISRNLIADQQ